MVLHDYPSDPRNSPFKNHRTPQLGSSQGILACRASTHAPPASTHKTKKKKKFFIKNILYLSSKHAEMHSNTLLLPFY
jgi:hypothetical protein